MVVQWSGCATRDPKVTGSIPSQCKLSRTFVFHMAKVSYLQHCNFFPLFGVQYFACIIRAENLTIHEMKLSIKSYKVNKFYT